MKIAVVILATGDYWKGAKVMFYTLRKYGNLPDCVDTIALGAECLGGPPLRMDWNHIPVNQVEFPRVAAKFEALTLGYDRVIMLDADMLCLGDCSLLWSLELTKSFYAVHDPGSKIYYGEQLEKIGLDPGRNFNGGIMIFNGIDILGELLQCIKDGLQSYDGGDQGYFNAYFQLVRPDLEVGYLLSIYDYVLDPVFIKDKAEDARIVHFTGSRFNPWNRQGISDTDWRMEWYKAWDVAWMECSK